MHDFDPAYAPDGRHRLRLDARQPRRRRASGPTRTPAALEPEREPVRVRRDGQIRASASSRSCSIRSCTPSFMRDGRLIFTAEKRAPDFHQLAGRRMNLDGGDYHPLFAQRPSIGFASATEIVELPDRNFAMVAAPLGASDGGGTIAIVNRSIGPDQDDRNAADRAYIHSLTTPAPGAFGGDAACSARRRRCRPVACWPPATCSDRPDPRSSPHYGAVRARPERRRVAAHAVQRASARRDRAGRGVRARAAQRVPARVSTSSTAARADRRRDRGRDGALLGLCRCWARCCSPTRGSAARSIAASRACSCSSHGRRRPARELRRRR